MLTDEDVAASEAYCRALPAVADCRILQRASGGAPRLVVYTVPTQFPIPDGVRAALATRFAPSGVRWSLVPVSALPLAGDGTIDDARLTALPVVDDELLRQAAATASAEYGVDCVATAIDRAPARARVHAEDLLPGLRAVQPARDAAVGQPAEATRPARSDSPAIADGGPLPRGSSEPERLFDTLRQAAAAGTGALIVRAPDDTEVTVSYARLLAEAEAGAAQLRAEGLEPGQPILLQLEDLGAFFRGFWACVAAGCVPVPAAVLQPQQDGAGPRMRALWHSLQRPPVLTEAAHAGALRDALSDGGGEPRLIQLHGQPRTAAAYEPAGPGSDVCLMMLTSGSTGTPKAVQLSHHNLIARSRGSALVNGFDASTRSLNWMPLDHVAGLIYFHLRDVYLGATQVHVPTASVLRSPLRWLDLCEAYQADVTFAPNFAFGLVCAETAAIRARRWDLSRLRHVLNGAEAIVARVSREFLRLLVPHGLPPTALVPAWGMAEVSSGITYDRHFSLESTADEDRHVHVGRPIPGTRLRIVDDDDRVVAEGVEGRLQAQGETLFAGYWNAANDEVFTADGWFRTGDLASIDGGRLIVTGREKDTVNVGGIKYPGPAIEAAIDGAPGVVPSFSAACAVRAPGDVTERLAVFFVPRDDRDAALERLLPDLRRRVFAAVGVTPDLLLPVTAERIPKTSIGKIQRARLQQSYAEGAFDVERRRYERLTASGDSLPNWFYRRRWRAKAPRPVTALRPGPVAVMGDAGLAARLETRLAGEREVVAVADAAALSGALAAHAPAVVVLSCAVVAPVGDALRDAVASVIEVAGTLAARSAKDRLRLAVVTSGPHAAPGNMALVTLARAIGRETAGLEVVHVHGADPVAACLEAFRHGDEAEVALHDGDRRVPFLEPVDPVASPDAPLRRHGLYLVSGGAGGVGRVVADRLLDDHDARVVVIGRRAEADLDGDARQWLQQRAEGRLRYVAADICDEARLAAALQALGEGWAGPADGAFHLAGTYHESTVAAERAERVCHAIATKALGAEVLLRHVAARRDAVFVGFGSLLGEFAGAGVGAYAAGSRSLSAVIESRAGSDGPRVYGLDWAVWRDLGMSRGVGAGAALRALGIHEMEPRKAWLSVLIALGQPAGHWLIGLDAGAAPVARRSLDLQPLRQAVVVSESQTPLFARLRCRDEGGVTVEADVIAVTAIPRTAGGAVDHLGLRDLMAASHRPYVEPRDALEQRLAQLWRQVLAVERIGVEDGFFELGGGSLAATQLLGAFEQAFNCRWSMRDLFDAPTIAAQAARLRATAPVERADGPQPRTSGQDRLPLSFTQRRLWLAGRVDPGNPIWNIHARLVWRHGVDAGALGRAIWRLGERHEALRTVFAEQDGEPAQIVGAEPMTTLSVTDLSALPDAPRAAAARRAAEADARQRFDLEHGPLLRAQLVRLGGPDELLLALHHLVGDGWSVRILFDELRALYAEETGGRVAALPPPALQYGDYALWQQREQVIAAPQVEYWLTRLRGVRHGTVLRGNRPRPLIRSTRGAILRLDLPRALDRAIDGACRRTGATLTAWLFACFAVLLRRWSGESDVVVGTVVANRQLPQLQTLVGCFVNVIVLRQQVEDETEFGVLAASTQAMLLEAQEHAEVPFEVLVERSGVARDGQFAPLFQIAFDVRDPRLNDSGRDDLALAVMDRDVGTAQYDLHLTIEPGRDRLTAIWNYNSDLFEPATVARLADAFVRIAETAAADPGVRVEAIELLSAEQREWLLRQMNASARSFPTACVHDQIAEQARRRPEAPALRCAGADISYRELEGRSARVAAHLQARGIGRGDLVGVALDRGPDLVVAILAVLRCGAAFVPIELGNPDARMAFIVSNSGCRGVLATTAASRVTGAPVFDLRIGLAAREPFVPVPVGPHDLAYLIYTSGSTGTPKGVLVEHRGLANLTGAQIEAFAIDETSRVLQFASIGFDAAVSEIFTALASGSTLVLASRDDLLPGPPLLELLRRERVSVATLVPSVLQVLPADPLPDLHTLVSAGEPLSLELARRWAPGRRMLNAYGPTEATVCATIGVVASDADTAPDVGVAMANCTVHILDARLEPVPVGVDGEICIGGPGVARGYHGRPDLTAERFVPDPFAADPSARLFRTGDYARRRADGRIEFAGRRDDQIKVGGVRIEIAEVEAALARLPGVGSAAITAVTRGGDTEMIGLVAATPAHRGRDGRALELWPSLAEFYVYDQLIYHAMVQDERRNACYRTAVERLVPGRVVVEIGSGPEAILALMCAAAGARHVYAIELLESSYRTAAAKVARLGLSDHITLIHGDATQVQLPEPADVCVSEIVGAIGGSEGAARIINDAWRHLRPGGVMLPCRSVTRMAGVSLPPAFLEQAAFGEVQSGYVEKIFAQVGRPFDLRVCLRGLGYDDLLTTDGVFEDLDFSAPIELEAEHDLTLDVARDGELSGFLVWLTLQTAPGAELDILAHEHCWLPVYVPLPDVPLVVSAGDRIRARVTRRLCDNGLNPDFWIDAELHSKDGRSRPLSVTCPQASTQLRGQAFYRQILTPDGQPRRSAVLDVAGLRAALAQELPDALIPAVIHAVDSIPTMPSGKVDRQALRHAVPPPPAVAGAPAAEAGDRIEHEIAQAWCEALGLASVDLDANFFDLGGNSLKAARVNADVQRRLGRPIPLTDHFRCPTVRTLAEHLRGGPVAAADRGADRAERLRRGRSLLDRQRARRSAGDRSG